MDFSEKLKTQLSNLFIIAAIPFAILQLIYNFLGPNTPSAYIAAAIWMVHLSIPLYLNHIKKQNAARMYLAWGTLALVAFSHYLHGSSMRLEPVYLLGVLINFYFFSAVSATSMSVFSIIVYAILSYAQKFYTAPLAAIIVPTAPLSYFGMSIIFTAVLSIRLLSENKRYNLLIRNKNEELEKKNEELKRFSYITSHDLKAPIRTIQSFAGLTGKAFQEGNIEKAQEYLQYIQKGGRELGNLVEDILDFSMIDQSLQYELVDLNQVIVEVKESLNSQINLNNSLLITPSDFPKYLGVKRHFKMLFQNIIQNGIKYNVSSQPKVEISYKIDDNRLKIYFKDNGIGIEEKYHLQIFEYFQRLHSNSTYEGSGIGLAICKKILEMYNGTIEVNSQSGEGSTFVVTLPIA